MTTTEPHPVEPVDSTEPVISARDVRVWYGTTRGATRYDPDDWKRFEAFCEQRGISTGLYMRKLVRGTLSGRVVVFDDLKPEALKELQEYADYLGLELPGAVAFIVTQALIERRRERSKK